MKQEATAPSARAKALVRWHRHNRRQVAAGRQRVVVSLPAHAVATLDAIRGNISRSDAVLEAIEVLGRREQAPALHAPAAPAPEAVPGMPHRKPPVSRLAVAALVARRDRANRFPVFVTLPAVAPGSDLEGILHDAGLRHRGTGWTGRLRGGSAQRLAPLVAAHGGLLHISGERGDDPLKPTDGAVPELPPPLRSAWIDALRGYWSRFQQVPPGGLFPPPLRPRPGHFSPPRRGGLTALAKQGLVPVLLGAVERGEVLTADKVGQALASARWWW